MSQQPKGNCPTFSLFSMVMAAAIMTAVPTWANAHEPTKSDTKAMSTGQMDHSKMDGMTKTGDVDYDFAANMRQHHQMAVDMSQAELKTGKDPQLLRMAKEIIVTQNKEIAVLDKWITANQKSVTKANY